MSEYRDVSSTIRRWLTACIYPTKDVRPDGEFKPQITSQPPHDQIAVERSLMLFKKGKPRSFPQKSVRVRPLYDNCLLLCKDGRPLARCSWRKATWYLRRGLASCTVKEGEEVRLQLNFRPQHRGRGLAGQFYMQRRENICVVCGVEGQRRKRLVPRRLRKLLPKVMKNHQSHDVVPMCAECHDMSNKLDRKMNSPVSPLNMISSFLSSGGLLQLEIAWRNHFLSTMQPQYLPPLWSLHHQGERLWHMASQKLVTPTDYKIATSGYDT